MALHALSCAIWILSCTLAQGYVRKMDYRPNVGISMHLSGDKMYASAESFTVTWNLKLPYQNAESRHLQVPQNRCNINDTVCNKEYEYLSQEVEACNAYLTTLQDNIHDLHALLQGFKKETRPRRGLFDLGGSILETLFGTATSESVETLHKEIMENTDLLQLLSTDMDEIYTEFDARLEMHGDKLGTMWQSLNLTHMELTSVRRNLLTLRSEIKNATAEIARAMSNRDIQLAYQHTRLTVEFKTTELLKMSLELSKLHNTIQTLRAGRLPHTLISFSELRKTLHKVRNKLSNMNSDLQPIMSDDDMYKYYMPSICSSR